MSLQVPPPTLVDDRILDEEEYEQPRRPVAQKPKQQQQYRPQPANYPPAPVQNRPQPQQQFYDYEEEIIATTAKPVQPPRPKFQQPQYSPAPAPPRPQFANAIQSDIVYADNKPSKSFKQQQPQFDAFENRQPAQFPQQQEFNPAPTQAPQQNYNINRPADFPLFTPVNSRADVFKKAQKVRSIYKISRTRAKPKSFKKRKMSTKRKKKNVYFVVRKKRRYYY